MRIIFSSIVSAFVVAFVASSASGASLSIIDGNSSVGFDLVSAVVPSGPLDKSNAENNFLEFAEANSAAVLSDRSALSDGRISVAGFFGGQVIGSASAYRYEYFGSEAKYKNTLTVGADSISTAGGTGGTGVYSLTPMGSFVSSSLAFEFSTSGNSTKVNNVMGSGGLGNNPNDTGDGVDMMSFGAVCVGDVTGADCGSIWLFLDDGGARENDDYDDMVIRITAVPAVPLPAAAWMLIAGLAGLCAPRLGRRYWSS
ncbi:MAG: VPLPA-CTERM sorting domain-containing protein [Pseudomonadota bacterium]